MTDERLAPLNDGAFRRWRREIGARLEQGREDGDVTVDTPDDVLVEPLLSLALGLQVLASCPIADEPDTRQLAMLDARPGRAQPR